VINYLKKSFVSETKIARPRKESLELVRLAEKKVEETERILCLINTHRKGGLNNMEKQFGLTNKKQKGTLCVGGDFDKDGVKNLEDAAPMNPSRKMREKSIKDFIKKNGFKL